MARNNNNNNALKVVAVAGTIAGLAYGGYAINRAYGATAPKKFAKSLNFLSIAKNVVTVGEIVPVTLAIYDQNVKSLPAGFHVRIAKVVDTIQQPFTDHFVSWGSLVDIDLLFLVPGTFDIAFSLEVKDLTGTVLPPALSGAISVTVQQPQSARPVVSDANVTVEIIGSTVKAVNRDQGVVDEGQAGQDDIDVMNAAVASLSRRQKCTAIGNFAGERPLNITSEKTFQLVGSIVKSAAFVGSELVRISGNYTAFDCTAGRVDGVNRVAGIDGIKCTSGGSVVGQKVLNGLVYNCDRNFYITRDPGVYPSHTNYLGVLQNCNSWDGLKGIVFEDAQVHDWAVYGFNAWNVREYGIRVVRGTSQFDGRPWRIRFYGGNIGMYPTGIACVESAGNECIFSDIWTEGANTGSTFDYLITPDALSNQIIRPLFVSLNGIRDLGINTSIELNPRNKLAEIWDDFTEGLGAWGIGFTGTGAVTETTLFAQTGALVLSTGLTAGGSATIAGRTRWLTIVGVIPPHMAVSFKLSSITDVFVMACALYMDSTYYTAWIYDSRLSPNWICRNVRAGVISDVNSGIPAAVNANNSLRMSTSTSTIRFMAGDLMFTNSVNVPSGVELAPRVSITSLADGVKTVTLKEVRAYKIRM